MSKSRIVEGIASVKAVAQKGQLHPLQRGEYALIANWPWAKVSSSVQRMPP